MSEAAKSTDQQSGEPKAQAAPIGFGAHVSRPILIPENELNKEHKFWDNQPVPKIRDGPPATNGPLDSPKTVEDIRKTPLNLPADFTWQELDISDDTQAEELFKLLDNNYVEDDDACFRFNYSIDCLRWALTPPGYFPEWHIGVRANNKLVAFISGVPSLVCVYGEEIPMAEINFLCVHKKLRSKRLAPVLIKEVTRRVNLQGIWQALYTAGVWLPRPIAECRYFHRALDIKKLVDVGFSRLPPRQTMSIAQRLVALPPDFTVPNIKPLEREHVQRCVELMKEDFLERKVGVHPVFREQAEAEHWLVPRPGILEGYVKLDDAGVVTDFFTFYELPSNVIKHNQIHSCVRAAYGYYTVAKSLSWGDLMLQALIAAKNKGYDVFNALDLGENRTFFDALKFGAGDGSLKYYLFNWGCPPMHPTQVGVILM